MKSSKFVAVNKLMSGESLAYEHWAWVVTWLELIYKDAFIHGYKHGREDNLNGRTKCLTQ
jgi:hypothetical protein